MKDKLQPDELLDSVDTGNDENSEENNLMAVSEVLSALIALGYSEKESEKVLKNIDKTDTVENMIKNALKALMN